MKKYNNEIGINFAIINVIPLIATLTNIIFWTGYYFKDFLFLYKIYLGWFIWNYILPNSYTFYDQIFYIIVLIIFNLLFVIFLFNTFVKDKDNIKNIYVTIFIITIISTLFWYLSSGITA